MLEKNTTVTSSDTTTVASKKLDCLDTDLGTVDSFSTWQIISLDDRAKSILHCKDITSNGGRRPHRILPLTNPKGEVTVTR